jgi:DNA-directed RNA polymerase subunit M/transcription elongation factor TFIIS
MAKVRFSCPSCQTVMLTSEDKIGFDIACPQCSHQFTLVEPSDSPSGQNTADSKVRGNPTSSPAVGSSTSVEETQNWNKAGGVGGSHPAEKPPEPAPYAYSPPTNIPPIYQGNATSGFCCPFCQTRHPPIWRSEISTAGWITFAILLICTCFFFWVGFLIREKYLVCSVCKVRLPGRHTN